MTVREIVLLGLLLAAGGASALANPAFLAPSNLRDLLTYCVPALIVGSALTFVIAAREIDVSVGAQLGLLAALLGVLSSPTRVGWPVEAVFAAVLAAGLLLGLLNGLLVVVAAAPSLIVTLGVRSVLLGSGALLMGAEWITDLPTAVRVLGLGEVGGVPLSILIAAGCVAAGLVVAHATPAGLSIFAMGSSDQAADLAGVPTVRLRVLVFAATGLATAVAVLVSVPQLAVVDTGIGIGFELTVITAVILGGTSVDGGRGRVLGTMLAVLLLGVLRSGLVYARLGESAVYWERAIQGTLIVAALIAEARRTARTARGELMRGRMHELVLAGALLVAGAVLALVDPDFVRPAVQLELATHLWEPLIVLIPLALLVLAGGIDLSVGSILALSSVTLGLLFELGAPLPVCVAAALLCGLAAGGLNGALAATLRVHPLLITLATFAAFRGIAEGLSGGRPVSGFPDSFTAWGVETVGGLPLAGWIALGAAVCGAVALDCTATGRRIRASGANETAARFVGIAVPRLQGWLYALTGLGAGAAAVLFAARRNTAKADAGFGLELELITALVLGGVRIGGGAGGIVGAVMGLVAIHMLREFISWRGIGDEWSELLVGGLLLAAVVAGAVRGWGGRRRPAR